MRPPAGSLAAALADDEDEELGKPQRRVSFTSELDANRDDIERRPRLPGDGSDDDSYHGGARLHPRRHPLLPPRNPAAASLATAPPRAIPQLKTATGGLAQPPARRSGGSAAGEASSSLAGTSPSAPGSFTGSYTGSYTLTDSPATSEAPTPTVRDMPALQHFGPAMGTLRPHFGEIPPQFRRSPQSSPLRTTSVPSATLRAAAIEAEAADDRAQPAGSQLGKPPRYHRRTASIGNEGMRARSPARSSFPGFGSSMPAHSSPAASSAGASSSVSGLRRSGLAPSAVEAAQADEVQGRLLRGQSLLSNDAANAIPEELRQVAAEVTGQQRKAGSLPRQATLRATDIATAAQAARSMADPPAGLPRVMLHAAVRSIGGAPGSEGGSSHPHTPQVVENAVAGDLMVAQTELRSRRQSTSSAPESQPSEPGKVKKNLTRIATSRRKSEVVQDAESDILEEDDLKEEEKEPQARKWWQSAWVRHMCIWIPIAVSACLLVAGIILVIFFRGRYALYFDAWRWCIFLACFVPIYWVSRLIVHLLVVIVEARLFSNAKVLYFMISVRKDLARMLRVALWIPVFAGLFGPVSDRAQGVHTVYFTFLRLLGCATLFWFAMVLKTIIARAVSSHFMKEAHFNKMKIALEKEAFLAALSQPRQEHRVDDVLLEQARSSNLDASGELHDLDPQQLQSLKFERDISKHNVAVSAVARVLRPGFMRRTSGDRRSSGGLQRTSGLQHAQTAPSELPEVVSRKLKRVVSRVDEEPEDAAELLSRVSHSHHSHVPSPPKSPPVSPAKSSRWPSAVAATAAASPKRGLKASLSRKKVQPTPSATPGKTTPSAKGSRAGKAKSEKVKDKDKEGLKQTVSLPGGGSSELDIVMKLHKVERHIRNSKLKVTLTEEIGAAGQEVSSKAQARRLAFYLFWNIKPYFDRNYIIKEDLEHFLSAKKAARAFEMLDVDHDGKVTLHNTRDAVIQVYQERKNLAATLKDTKTVIGRLEYLIMVTVHLCFIFFYLLIFRVNVNKVWLTVSSVLLGLSFIFGNSIRNVFESVVFLFVVHPFDVGDALLITDPAYTADGPQYNKVEEIMLLNTKVKRWDGACIYYPNTILNQNPLINLSRSDNKWEFFKLYLDIGTPGSVFEALNERIAEHLGTFAGEFTGQFSAMNISSGDPMKIQLGVFFEFSHNGVDQGRTGRARHGLFALICETLTELGACYSLPAFSHDPRGKGDSSMAREAAMLGGGAASLGGGAAARPYSFY